MTSPRLDRGGASGELAATGRAAKGRVGKPRGTRRQATKEPAAAAPPVNGRPGKGRGRDFVYETLKQRIVSLRLGPGVELDEAQLGADLGVSRTPLREALVKLAGDGLVVLMPNRGARVAPMDLSHIQEHLEAFDLMQRIATSWAASRRSDEELRAIAALGMEFEKAESLRDTEQMIELNFRFHQAIGLACGNRNIAKFYTGLLSEGLRIARLAMAYECYGSEEAFEAHVSTIVREHREIVEAIGRRDVEAAETLAASHSGLARKRVIEYLSISLVGGLNIMPATAVLA